MSRIPWYYIWSEKYEIFHTIFQDITSRVYPSLREEFSIRPIYIEQQEFQKKLSKKISEHPFSGCNMKIDALINCIEANMGSNFLFTDIDIIIRQPTIISMINPFLNSDMSFMTEDIGTKTANIGFCLIKASEKTLKFWKEVQNRVTLESGHDQAIVNDMLTRSSLCVNFFSEKDIISQKTCTHDADFKVVQILSSGNNTPHWQFIEKLYTLPLFIQLEPYNYLISKQNKDDVKKFSELVSRSK